MNSRLWILAPVLAYLVAVSAWTLAFGIKPRYDGTIYHSGGASIAAGLGFVVDSHYSETGRTYTRRFPPGYPSLIALGVRGGLSAQHSAFAINAVAGLAAIVFLYLLLLRHDVPEMVAAWLSAGVAVSEYHVDLIPKLLTEPLSVAMLLGVMLLADSRPWFAGVLAALAWTVRNSMLSIVAALGFYYLWQRQWRAAAWCLFGGIVGGGWLAVCNYLNWGSVLPYTGSESERTIFGCTWAASRSILVMFSPLVLVFFCLRPKMPHLLVVLWIGFFVAIMFAGNLKWKMDPLNVRMMMPLLWAGVLAIGLHWRERAAAVFVAFWPLYSAAAVSKVLLWKAMQ